MTLLEATQLRVRFGGVVAVDGVDVRVDTGEVLGVIGPNGSGKTSLLDALSGYEGYEGTVLLAGEPLDGAAAHERARRGMARTFQALELLDDLTVAENVGVNRSDRDVDAALAAVGAARLKLVRVAELGNAERRLVALARAVAGSPRVLLVDEVAAGLDGDARRTIARCLRSVSDNGAAVVLVDHNVDFVVGLADRVLVLDHGKTIAVGKPHEIRNDRRVLSAYLGTTP